MIKHFKAIINNNSKIIQIKDTSCSIRLYNLMLKTPALQHEKVLL